MLLIIIGLIITLEMLALLWLNRSVRAYKKYWDNKQSETGDITYLALGDSAAQGIGATSPMKGYVGLIAKRIENQANKKVRIINISKTGAKLSDYLNNQAPQIKNIKPDIVTIEIGANNIKQLDKNNFRFEFRQVLDSLPNGAYVSNMPLFNSRLGSTKNAKTTSVIIKEELQNYPKLHFVDLQKQTMQNQSIFGFAPDLFHPNNLSYKNWANAFWAEISKNKIG